MVKMASNSKIAKLSEVKEEADKKTWHEDYYLNLILR